MTASMSQTERVLRIQRMLQVRKVIPRKEFLRELEISLATFKRDLEFLRSRFQVNISGAGSAAESLPSSLSIYKRKENYVRLL